MRVDAVDDDLTGGAWDADGFVLAGGRGLRMGADKALVLSAGVPLGLRVACLLGRRCARVSLVRRDLPDPGWTLADGRSVGVVRDEEAVHPLWGVHAALRSATSPWALVVATDLVGLRVAHLDALWSARGTAGAVLVASEGWRFAMLLASSSGPDVAALAAAGAPVGALVGGLARVAVPDPVVDANTPADLASRDRSG